MPATSTTPNGTLGVDYQQAGIIALAAIKELEAQIIVLQTKLHKLEAHK